MSASETVLITGASSGIGLELAKRFAADGSRVILVARNKIALEKLAEELRRENKIEAVVLPADLALPETSKKIFEKLSASGISVDVLVNNAGFGLHGAFTELSLERQLEIIRVNVMALAELTGLFLPEILKRGRGGILNVGSVAGFLPGPNMAVYYATKAFVQSFTEALAEETVGTGVAVSALDPGPTETNFGTIARGQKVRRIQTGKMSAKAVAHYGHHAFRTGKIIAVPGFRNRMLIFLTRLAPRRLTRKTVKTYNQFEG